MSEERKKYLKNIKKQKIIITLTRLSIIGLILITWQILANLNIINTFLYSSPKLIIINIINLVKTNTLLPNVLQTLKEIIISFSLCELISIILAIFLYENKLVAKIVEPFIILINSMPKVALGPLIIILAGANIKSIIIMSLLISVIVTTLTIYNGIENIDNNKLKLLKTLKATKLQELKYLIIPHSIPYIISSLKVNISMTLIGIIMGEFLISKKGIGYLIIYGSQVFDLNLVFTGIILLLIISYIIYYIVQFIETKFNKNN